VCTLLSTCGQYFDRGTSEKKLDRFLAYQRYYLAKSFIPMDIEYMVADTFDTIKPKLARYTTLQQAWYDPRQHLIVALMIAVCTRAHDRVADESYVQRRD